MLGGERAVILTHATWERRFGASPEIVGATISLNGEPTPVGGKIPTVEALLFGVEATDGLTFVVMTMGLVLVAGAARIEPTVASRMG